jgi:hypothetical protein
MDTFPYETWEEAGRRATEEGAGFFTFGPGDNVATIILVVIGIVVMLLAFWGWIWVEDRKLREQAARLRAAGEEM